MQVEKGPRDLREIPSHFGRAAKTRDYGAWDIEIVAEINNAPRLTRGALRGVAEYFRASGADVIDLGCTPGVAVSPSRPPAREVAFAGDASDCRTSRQRRYCPGCLCLRHTWP